VVDNILTATVLPEKVTNDYAITAALEEVEEDDEWEGRYTEFEVSTRGRLPRWPNWKSPKGLKFDDGKLYQGGGK
jgi:hypothetical protein